METYLHFAIKLAVCSFAFYGIWILLNRMFIRQKKEAIPAKREPTIEKTIVEEIPEDESPQPKDYYSLFLNKNSGTKRQTYVNADLYDKISKLLAITAKDISVPNFINNVLENHLKEYKEEINKLYRNNSDLLL